MYDFCELYDGRNPFRVSVTNRGAEHVTDIYLKTRKDAPQNVTHHASIFACHERMAEAE